MLLIYITNINIEHQVYKLSANRVKNYFYPPIQIIGRYICASLNVKKMFWCNLIIEFCMDNVFCMLVFFFTYLIGNMFNRF